jgi:hypothetical protein
MCRSGKELQEFDRVVVTAAVNVAACAMAEAVTHRPLAEEAGFDPRPFPV